MSPRSGSKLELLWLGRLSEIEKSRAEKAKAWQNAMPRVRILFEPPASAYARKQGMKALILHGLVLLFTTAL